MSMETIADDIKVGLPRDGAERRRNYLARHIEFLGRESATRAVAFHLQRNGGKKFDSANSLKSLREFISELRAQIDVGDDDLTENEAFELAKSAFDEHFAQVSASCNLEEMREARKS